MSRGRVESAGKPATRHWPVNRPCPASAGNAESRLQPRVTGRVRSLLVLCSVALLAARSLPAQAIGQGFELERSGQYEQAAAIYLATLRAEPTNISALLGLERVLPPLNRLGELLPVAQRAAAANPSNVALRGVLLRTYVALNEPDSARALALEWARAAPRDEAPYREWAMALEEAHRHAAARDVLLAGRRALGRAGAFGIEMAELSQLSGDWEGAAREWAAALTDGPVQLPNAASALGEAPDGQRERIARLLTDGTPSPLARRLAGELLLGWGQPLRGWAVFEPSVATPSADAAFAARRFADLAAGRNSPGARRVRALALARYADLSPPGGTATRARADAARAFIEAGDQVAARAVLERVAQDSNAPPDAQRLAQRAVVEALIDGGKRDEAARQLASNARLSADDRASLRLRLARASMLAGELDRAETELARDSSVETIALRGWIALYRGRLSDAHRLFLSAGPYAGDRRDATERTEMVALLQQVPGDSYPALGGALLLLAQGDSVRAAAALRLAAGRLATGGGGEGSGWPDLLLLAGRVAARLDTAQQRSALQVFDEVVRAAGQGAAAPAAELEWARLLERRTETVEAIRHLEHLILTYPGSAVVPEARRELERAKGAIPRS